MKTASFSARYGRNLPRYTSYPTAVQFSGQVGPVEAARWMREIPEGEPVSLYFHVPFCDELCLFCGCNTSVVRQENGRLAYAELLLEELRRVAALLGPGRPVSHVHFGGGTPTTLPPLALEALMQAVHRLFRVADDAEIGIELDPRHLPPDCAALLARLGFTRVSLGVQDLDLAVQQACGRVQSFEQTESCIASMRAAGIARVNIDLIYGLPLQTTEGASLTAGRIATLRPDRLAVFGYAHVPWKERRQQLIVTAMLPDAAARLGQREAIDQVLRKAGYRPVGLDHYALPEDSLCHAADSGTLRRNFQGYSTDAAQRLIGIGASAISMFPRGFSQNASTAVDYAGSMNESQGLPAVRGVVRSGEDCVRAALIEQVMCAMRVTVPEDFVTERRALSAFVEDGLAEMEGDIIRVTEKGRPFLRNIASVFDRYLPAEGVARHASAI